MCYVVSALREHQELAICLSLAVGFFVGRPFALSRRRRQSKLPALGYPVPYALGNILLTAWGPGIVALMR